MTTFEDIADPWKKKTKNALDKATDDKISTMDRDQQIELRKELELCLEREKYGIPYSHTDQMNAGNPIGCIIKGSSMMKEVSLNQTKKNTAIQKITQRLSTLAEYTEIERNDPQHQNNLNIARLEMELNATGKEAATADYYTICECVDKEKGLKAEIKALNDANDVILTQQNEQVDQGLQMPQVSQNAQNSNDDVAKQILAGLVVVGTATVVATNPAPAVMAVAALLIKPNAPSVPNTLQPPPPLDINIGQRTKSFNLNIDFTRLDFTKPKIDFTKPKIDFTKPKIDFTKPKIEFTKIRKSASTTSKMKTDPVKTVNKILTTTKTNVVNGVIGGVIGGVSGVAGIKLAQNILECEEHQKLNCKETAGVVAACVVGGAGAMIAAPAILTGIGIAVGATVFGAGVQWIKKSNTSL